MQLRIEPAAEKWIEAVKAFNLRLAAGKGSYKFPERYIPLRFPPLAGRTIYQEYYLVLDDSNNVRGAFILKRQLYKIKSDIKSIAHLELPISEGNVNPEYSYVAFYLIRASLEIEPRLYTYGMGGINRPLANSLKELDWFCTLVPFYLKIINAKNFLKNAKPLRSSKIRRIGADFLAVSGLGSLGNMIYNFTRKKVSLVGISTEIFSTFGEWSDILWSEFKDEYDFTAVRDQNAMNTLYPEAERYLKVKVMINDKAIGWVVAIVSQLNNHNYFKNMKVATILNCWGPKNKYDKIIASALKEIKNQGEVDMVISNQSNNIFEEVFKQNGFIKGPSNLGFCFSPDICDDLGLGENRSKLAKINSHFNRGDGDGALNL